MITISSAELIGFSKKYGFPSEGAHNFRNIIDISISAFLSDITNEEGLMLGLANFIAIRESADYQNFRINGRTYQSCKLNSFETDDGDWVNTARISLSISIIEEGQDVFSIDGNYEDILAGQWKIFNSLEESVSISRGENSTSYSRTISAELNRSANLVLPTSATKGSAEINIARQIIKSILDYDKDNGYSYDVLEVDSEIADLLISSQFKKNRREIYNEISNTVSITESVDTSNVVEDEIGHNYTIEISANEDGIIKATEKGKIEGLISDKYSTASSWLDSIISDAKTRIEDTISNHFLSKNIALIEEGGALLVTESSIVHNVYEGWIEYSISCTNDPNVENGHSYSIEISRDGCYSIASERGKFFSLLNDGNSIDYRYNQSYTSYLAEISVIDARLKTYVTCLMTEPYQRSENHDFAVGGIEYSRAFTDNPIYDNGLSVSGYKVKKYEVSKNASIPVKRTQVFSVLGKSSQIVQTLNNLTESNNSYSLSMLLERIPVSEDVTKLTDTVDLAKTKINELLTDDSVDPEDRILEVSHNWAPLNDVTFNIDLAVSTSESC